MLQLRTRYLWRITEEATPGKLVTSMLLTLWTKSQDGALCANSEDMSLLGVKIQIPRSSIRQMLRNLEAQVSVRKDGRRRGRSIEVLAMSEVKNASMAGIMTAIKAIAAAHHIVMTANAIKVIAGAHHTVMTERL